MKYGLAFNAMEDPEVENPTPESLEAGWIDYTTLNLSELTFYDSVKELLKAAKEGNGSDQFDTGTYEIVEREEEEESSPVEDIERMLTENKFFMEDYEVQRVTEGMEVVKVEFESASGFIGPKAMNRLVGYGYTVSSIDFRAGRMSLRPIKEDSEQLTLEGVSRVNEVVE